MTKQEFSKAVEIAKSDKKLEQFSTELLLGFALPNFNPVTLIIESVAECIRWQCARFDGGWDNDAMNECWKCFQHKVSIAG